MMRGCLKKPNRPPPPPPFDDSPELGSHLASSELNSSSSSSNSSYHRKANSRSDYIKISECHSGLPDPNNRFFTQHHKQYHKPLGFKSRTSTSFSSTLKPSTSNFSHSSHQKSRSLTDSAYLYLDLPSSLASKHAPTSPSIVYNCVDFLKTDALTKCKVERTSGRA